MKRILSVRNFRRAVFLSVLIFGLGETANAAKLDPDAVANWADQLLTNALADKRMSGAVLTLVQDGNIVLTKGYGYADYGAKSPVDPANTRFRIGSITKTFTAMAIAQLLDDGRIASLDDPANKYLKRLQLPAPKGIDITLSQLLTHAAGFENRAFNIATDKSVDLPLSPIDIDRFRSEVVNSPGRYSSYNNYGTALLALIVEDVTSQTIADYFAEHIFKPLGMTKSVLNMSPAPSPELSVPYGFLPNGEPLIIKHRSIQQFYAPVGGINSTADDMGRYMLAQLSDGMNKDAILSHNMFTRMHTQIRSNHPLSSGFGMIYFTWLWNDTPVVLHGGDWPGTHSGMVLLPDSNTGLFFSLLADYPEVPILESLMGSERLQPRDGLVVNKPITNLAVIYNFLETFYGEYERPQLPVFSPADFSEYAGSYVGQSAPASTMERLLNLINAHMVADVTPSGDGTGLMINGRGPYREIGQDVFWNDSMVMPIDGLFLDSKIFSFVRDAHGAVDYLTPQIGFDVWKKSAALDNPRIYLVAWAILLAIVLTAVACAFYPKVDGHPLAKWTPVSILLLVAAMPLILLIEYHEGESVIDDLFFGRMGRFVAFSVAANLIAMGALFFAWQVYLAWKKKFWHGRTGGLVMRLHYSIVGLAALLLVPVFAYLNLLVVQVLQG
jgi:CubicO group peptidase (beta-lactamase class C family)